MQAYLVSGMKSLHFEVWYAPNATTAAQGYERLHGERCAVEFSPYAGIVTYETWVGGPQMTNQP